MLCELLCSLTAKWEVWSLKSQTTVVYLMLRGNRGTASQGAWCGHLGGYRAKGDSPIPVPSLIEMQIS